MRSPLLMPLLADLAEALGRVQSIDTGGLRTRVPLGTSVAAIVARRVDEKVARWQERIEPLWKPLAGGCHLTQHVTEDIERAGFEMQQLATYYLEGEPKSIGYTYEGVAVSR